MERDKWLVIGKPFKDLETIIMSTWNASGFKRSWWKLDRDVDKIISIKQLSNLSHDLKGVSSVSIGSILFCSGGINKTEECSNNVSFYDLENECWNERAGAQCLDRPRSDHVSLSLGIAESYVFGGSDSAFGSTLSTTPTGSDAYSLGSERRISSPPKFGDYEKKVQSFVCFKKSNKGTAYFWMKVKKVKKDEGEKEKDKENNVPVLRYDFAKKEWKDENGEISSKTPSNRESPQVGNYFLSIVQDEIFCFNVEQEVWTYLYTLSIQPKADEQVHLVHLTEGKICVLYMDNNKQLYCFYFRFDRTNLSLIQDGGAVFSFEVESELATVSFMSQDAKKRKQKEQEEETWGFNVKVRRTEELNQFDMTLWDNKTWESSKRMSLLKNSDPHKNLHSKEDHPNVLRHVFHSDKSFCMLAGWGKSLCEIVNSGDVIKTLWEVVIIVEGYLYYNMSDTFLNIVSGILKGLKSFRDQNIPIKSLQMKDIVFQNGDDQYRNPFLIDCNIVGGPEGSRDLKVLASLIDSIATKHILEGKMKKARLFPTVSEFLKFLNGGFGSSNPEEKALKHPIFLSDSGKTDYLLRIRSRMYKPLWHLGIDVKDLFSFPYHQGHRTDSWKTLIPEKWYDLFDIAKEGEDDFQSVDRFVVVLRNGFIHANDKKSGKKDPPYMSGEAFGKLFDEASPTLLPLVYEKYGELLDEKDRK